MDSSSFVAIVVVEVIISNISIMAVVLIITTNFDCDDCVIIQYDVMDITDCADCDDCAIIQYDV